MTTIQTARLRRISVSEIWVWRANVFFPEICNAGWARYEKPHFR